ncbi:MAG: hypothetical protein HY835_13765 [Anaerolineae bacterium]|nr:hypothetical protein [Anaerolineae bacterium]
MNTSTRSIGQRIRDLLNLLPPGLFFLVLIFGALIAFEIFNYSTTDHALQDLLGDIRFGGLRWSTVLALAFCGIDFAGIARLFTPEQGMEEPKEVWYLFGAWLLAATMNAILTWWGVSMAITNHQVSSTAIIDPKTLATVVPVFVAVMVWVIRILIIGTLSLAMDRALHNGVRRPSGLRRSPAAQPTLNAPASLSTPAGLTPRPSLARTSAPAPSQNVGGRPAASFTARSEPQPEPAQRSYPEPTYHSLSMNARPNTNNTAPRTADGAGSTPARRL